MLNIPTLTICIVNSQRNDLSAAVKKVYENGIKKVHKYLDGLTGNASISLRTTKSSFNKVVFEVKVTHIRTNTKGTKYKDTVNTVHVLPCLRNGYRIKITGSNYDDVRDSIEELFTRLITFELGTGETIL